MGRVRYKGGRGASQRRAPRRRSSWVELVNEASDTNTALATIREIVLLLPLADHEAVTLIRIVGCTVMALQADDPAGWVPLVWGIHWATTGSVASSQFNPIADADMESEHWMHLRTIIGNTGANNLVMESMSAERGAQVDIKVKRVVNEGDGIKQVFNCIKAYRSISRLRGLVLHT